MIIAQVTIETTGAMLLGTEIAAALTALRAARHRHDRAELRDRPGGDERAPAPPGRRTRSIPISCEPNAGLPMLTPDGASYPLTPAAAGRRSRPVHQGVRPVAGRRLLRHHPGAHRRPGRPGGRRSPTAPRRPRREPGVASLYAHVPFRQDTAFLAIGERTNANGSKAFRDAMLDGKCEDCVQIARSQTRDGAHLLDVCVDYVGRDGVADMREVAGRLATAATLPLVLDSTEPAVIEAGLELTGGRSVINSVNYEDGDGPDSRIARVMPMVREHGAAVIALTIDEQGQARTAEWKVAVAERLIADLTGNWGMRSRRHHRGLPDLPDLHRPGGDPPGRHRDHRGDRRAEAPPPDRADHAGRVQRLVRPQARRPGRAELGLPGRMRPGRAWTPRSCTRRGSCRSPGSRTSSARSRWT